MIRIDDKIKNKFYEDSVHKDLIIECEKFVDTETNYMTGSVGLFYPTNLSRGGTVLIPLVDDFNYWVDMSQYYDKMCYAFDFYHDTNSSNVYDSFELWMSVYDENGGFKERIIKSYTKDQCINATESSPLKISYILPSNTSKFDMQFVLSDSATSIKCNIYTIFRQVNFSNNEDELPFAYSQFSEERVAYVKEQLKQSYFEPITNNELIAESMKMTESLCSSDNLKLGACESSVFEITVANRKDNFKNTVIKPYLQVSMPDPSVVKSINFYKGETPAPGATTGYSGYWDNRTFSSFFYTRAIDLDTVAVSYAVPTQYLCFRVDFEVLQCTLSAVNDLYITVMPGGIWHDKDNPKTKYYNYMTYSGNMERTMKYNTVFKLSDCINTVHRTRCYVPLVLLESNVTKILDSFDNLAFKLTDSAANYVTEGVTGDMRIRFNNVQITIVDELGEIPPEYNVQDCIAYNQKYGGETIDEYLHNKTFFKIPLGRYIVKDIKVEHVRDVIKKTLTCYDPLYKLSENAANWYTSYMYATNTGVWSSETRPVYDFEYVRQLYSTYFNIAKLYGFEKLEPKNEEKITEYTFAEGYFSFRTFFAGGKGAIWHDYVDFTPEPGYVYRVSDIAYNNTIEYYKSIFTDYADDDPLFRGIFDNASVYVVERKNNAPTRKYLVNVDDYFCISEDCDTVRVHFGFRYDPPTGAAVRFAESMSIFKLKKDVPIKNKCVRLLYYKFYKPEREDIFEVDSSITVRDVIRSLLELTGCFYNLDREGNPQFIYCTKTSLYPSETLYPADNLFPRGAANETTLPMSRYRSFECQEYTVQDIGKIQILKNTNTNEGSICEWEYVGNPAKQNTYIIDDNIFLCNENMLYEPGSMPEVSSMLEEMYTAISNMSYTPNTTICIGMPWIEVGDRIMLLTKTGGAESFIFRRTLTGIQALKDTYESTGDEIVEAINKYDY